MASWGLGVEGFGGTLSLSLVAECGGVAGVFVEPAVVRQPGLGALGHEEMA